MFDGNQSWVDGMILKVSDIPSESNKQVSVKNNPVNTHQRPKMKCCQRQIGHHLRVLLLLISEIVAPLIVPGGRGVVLPKQNSSLTRVSQGLSIQRGWWGKKPRDCKKLVRAQTLDASQTGKVWDSWEISRHLVGTQILEVDCL